MQKEGSQPKGIKFVISEMIGGGYHPFLNVVVEGKKCRFLIDTGASKSVIDKHFYENSLGRKMKVIRQETTGLHSTVLESYTGLIKKLEIGQTDIKKLAIAGVDLSHVNNTYKKMKLKKIHGIIGSDILKQHKAIIDYGKGLIFLN